ncbi:MAG: response regulator [Nitrospina sp.]|nr:response regulator [Nitrospina sp.]MBT5631627.1 response regulator [Nitrospina sp.]
MNANAQNNFQRHVLEILFLGLSYIFVGLLGTKLALPPGYASAVFPASGIALFAILWRGYSIWPGILLGSFSMNLWISFQNNPDLSFVLFLPVGLAIGLGASAEALFGAYVFQRLMGTNNPLERVFTLIVFALFSAVLGSMISASVGVTSLCLAQIAPWANFLENWFTWWLGDAIGILIFTPMLMVLIKLNSFRLKSVQILEAVLLLFFIFIVSKGVFAGGFTDIPYPLVFLTFPILIWFAFRLGEPGAMIGIGLVSLIATLETINGNGPFIVNRSPNESLLLLQIFLGSITLFTLFFTASLNENKQIEKSYNHLLAEIGTMHTGVPLPVRSNLPANQPTHPSTPGLGGEFSSLAQSAKENLFGLPSLVGIAIIIFTLFIWRGMILEDEKNITNRMGLKLTHIKSEILNKIDHQILALKRMTAHWSFQGEARQEEWVNDMNLHYNDYPIYQAIGWVDSTFHVRWIVPLEGNEKAVNLDLSFEEKRRRTLEKIRQAKSLAITPPISLVQGGKGFIIYIPVYFEDNFGGMISGVFQIKKLFDFILTEETHKGVSIAIYNGEEEIYRKNPSSWPIPDPFLQKATLNFYNVNWRLEVGQDAEFFSKNQNNSSKLVLMLGIFMALVISFATYFAQKEQLRAKQIELARRELEKEIEKRKQAEKKILHAKEEAEDASLAKSLFLANMSHEIRTPLNAILGFSQILLRNKDLTQEIKDSIRTIDISGQNLLTMINEILDISKIEAGKMELNTFDFDLKHLVDHVSNLFELRCQQKDLQWNVKGLSRSVMVRGDEIKLQQVLINLLGNAIKFTESGKVEFYVTALKDNHYQFDVIDSGHGIPIEAQGKVFNAFYQDEEGAKKGGTGLGLAISKKQLELMGSDLLLKSEINQGTHFYFILTLPPSEKEVKVDGRGENRTILHLSPESKVKALVVDDIKDNRDVLCQMLSGIGVETIIAVDGKEGVEKTKEHHPDLILMDIRMPVMGGEDAIKEIHDEFGKDRFKIVAITADAIDQRRDYYLSIGCHEYISKPFQADEIYNCLDKLLDVEFIYDDDEVSQKKLSSMEKLDLTGISMPEGLCGRMMKSAGLYSITELERNLAELGQNSEISEQLVEHLKQLLGKYDMEAIVKVLESVSKTKDSPSLE